MLETKLFALLDLSLLRFDSVCALVFSSCNKNECESILILQEFSPSSSAQGAGTLL